MGRHTGDYLLGTTFLAVAIILAIFQGKSGAVIQHPGEPGDVSHTLHSSRWKSGTALRQRSAINNTSLPTARAALKDLSRGTRIVVGSLDVSGGRHGLSVTVGIDAGARLGTLPVTRCSVTDIRHRRNEKDLTSSTVPDSRPGAGNRVEKGVWNFGGIRKLRKNLMPESSRHLFQPIRDSRTSPMRFGVEIEQGPPVGVVCDHGSIDAPTRVFLTPHFLDTGTVHEPAECRFIGDSPRVRIYVDQRLVQSTIGGQIAAWPEPLMSAAESRALPIVDAWVGAIRDVDHDQRLSIVVSDLDRRGRHAPGSSPIHGCIRESDFRSDSDFRGDIVYIDPSIFELPTDELAALLTHETTHAAVCSLRPDDSIGAADKANSGRGCSESQVPAWLNEAVAHFVELQCCDEDVRAAGVSQNFQRRMDEFFANPAGSPIVAAEDVLNLEERRGGSRGAATLFLARWFSSSETLQQFVRSQAAFDCRIEDLAREPFADVFRDWTLSLATLSLPPTSPASKTVTSLEYVSLRVDLLPATGNETRFSLLGTAFRCFECSEDIGSLVIESDEAAKLQISIIEPESHVTTMANAVFVSGS